MLIQMSLMSLLYWKNAGGNPMSKYVPENKYIITTLWPGGMNNVRISFETSCALAYCTNRILVVPELCYIDHLRSASGDNMHDLRMFFEFDDLGISVMGLTEFCNKEGISLDELNDGSKCTVYNTHNFNTCHNYIGIRSNDDDTAVPKLKCFLNRTEITLREDSKYVYFNNCLLGTFYSMIWNSNADAENWVKLYVCKHVHYKPHFVEAAMKIVQWLKREHGGAYHSMHVRRGDFMWCGYKYTCCTMDDVMKHIEPHAPENACLYIATDSNDLNEFSVLKTKYKVVTLQEALSHANANANEDDDDGGGLVIDPACYGMIEQIICAHGTKFFSHPLSTFSNYVYRLRGYMNIPDMNCYQTTTAEKTITTIDAEWACPSNVWSKEFVDGFMPSCAFSQMHDECMNS